MATAIEKNFGIKSKLKEGHGGIYEITLNGDLIYSNREAGGRFPEHEAIFQKILNYKIPRGVIEIKEQTPQSESPAPSCKWPP